MSCTRTSVLFAIAILVTLVAALRAPPVDACARVSEAPIALEGEEALIVWDPATHTQHLIRTGLFAEATDDFGFLVPTPTRPELAEANDGVFERLFRIYRRPPRRVRARARALGRAMGGGTPSVALIERRMVAGLDTSVLAANDADALSAWLREHRYPSSDALTEWFRKYVDEGWFVTAFRYAPARGSGAWFNRSVRMTFQTERPFFPYSEPSGGSASPRPFRISLIAPEPMRAQGRRRVFRGRVAFARSLPDYQLERLLAGVVPGSAIPSEAFLTVLDEPRSRRGARDLWFEPNPRRRRVRPTITTRIAPRAARSPRRR